MSVKNNVIYERSFRVEQTVSLSSFLEPVVEQVFSSSFFTPCYQGNSS